jgi:mRNA interferase MazF
MRRGEIWATSASGYAGKPRPAVIVQDDSFDATDSITVCGLTTTDIGPAVFRVAIEPAKTSGLGLTSWIMVDKISTVPKQKLGRRIGCVNEGDLVHLNRAILTFLGLV